MLPWRNWICLRRKKRLLLSQSLHAKCNGLENKTLKNRNVACRTLQLLSAGNLLFSWPGQGKSAGLVASRMCLCAQGARHITAHHSALQIRAKRVAATGRFLGSVVLQPAYNVVSRKFVPRIQQGYAICDLARFGLALNLHGSGSWWRQAGPHAEDWIEEWTTTPRKRYCTISKPHNISILWFRIMFSYIKAACVLFSWF